MLFNSITFLVFALIFFSVYFKLKGKTRLVFTLVASNIFYGWWDYRFLTLIWISTLTDYFVGLRLERLSEQGLRKKYLTLSICINLGILGIFKYFDFFISSFSNLLTIVGLNASLPLLKLALPIGISFYTFQTMSYTIDVYRGKCETEKDLLRFATYVSLFPQLVAGPIVRAKSLLPQLKHDHDVNWQRIAGAVEMIAWGFFLKLCLADTLAMEVGPKFDSPDGYGALSHMMSAVFFSFQIYGDFAGYSLIAIGLGRVMGFDFGVNFNRPYFSKSFNEFWQRWHISLSSWLRDYLYIPLGGNRKNTINTTRNLVIVMFLGGLWHGAAWTFVIWGMLHGVYLVLQNIVKNYVTPIIARWGYVKELLPALSIAIVFFLTVIAWIFFRAKNVDTAWDIITIIFTGKNIYSNVVLNKFVFLKGVFFILITLTVDLLSMNERVTNYYYSSTYLRAVCVIVLLWIMSFVGTFNESIFIYFQF